MDSQETNFFVIGSDSDEHFKSERRIYLGALKQELRNLFPEYRKWSLGKKYDHRPHMNMEWEPGPSGTGYYLMKLPLNAIFTKDHTVSQFIDNQITIIRRIDFQKKQVKHPVFIFEDTGTGMRKFSENQEDWDPHLTLDSIFLNARSNQKVTDLIGQETKQKLERVAQLMFRYGLYEYLGSEIERLSAHFKHPVDFPAFILFQERFRPR